MRILNRFVRPNRCVWPTITLAFVVISLSSCKNEDIGNPQLTLHGPDSGAIFYSGQSIPFSALFTDDLDLLKYTVTIQYIQQPHYARTLHPIESFLYSKETGLVGESQHVSESIAIPVNVARNKYELRTYVTDNAGKESEVQTVEFEIINSTDTIYPVLQVDNLSESNVNNATVGSVVVVEGDVSDNVELAVIELVLMRVSDDFEAFYQDYHLEGANDTHYAELTMPLVPGLYQLYVILRDKVNNKVRKIYPILVS